MDFHGRRPLFFALEMELPHEARGERSFIMTETQWQFFTDFRTDFKEQCHQWNEAFATELEPLQKAAASKDTPEYPVETGVVYNHALDEVTKDTDIKLIVIGDNPGKDEQLLCNQRYLVGQAGKIAAGFFSRNPELAIDFRKNTIILNKTPVHTAKTTHLRYLLKNGGSEITHLIQESQLWMAQKTAQLHQVLCSAPGSGGKNASDKNVSSDEIKDGAGWAGCQLWLVGYAELKGRGLFLDYRNQLAKSYGIELTGEGQVDSAPQGFLPQWNQVMVFQHFSMNRFTIDLAEKLHEGKINSQLPLQEQLAVLGAFHRQEIFGC